MLVGMVYLVGILWITGHSQGFCILNNVAIGTFHALIKYSGLKVAIIDIDLHAGNGTQDILEGFLHDHAEYRNSVLFASIHQRDIFPFLSDNRLPPNGVDPSSFINLGLTGIVDSNKWRHHIQSSIIPRLKAFGPDLVLLSAGFDGHKNDTYAHAQLSVVR